MLEYICGTIVTQNCDALESNTRYIKYLSLVLIIVPCIAFGAFVIKPSTPGAKIVVPVIEEVVSEEPVRASKQELLAFTLSMSDKYDVSFHELYVTLDGESDFIGHAQGDGGLANGPSQYHRGTFDAFLAEALEQGYPFNGFAYEDPYDQIELMAWAFLQGESHKEHWTCYRARISKTLPQSWCPW